MFVLMGSLDFFIFFLVGVELYVKRFQEERDVFFRERDLVFREKEIKEIEIYKFYEEGNFLK